MWCASSHYPLGLPVNLCMTIAAFQQCIFLVCCIYVRSVLFFVSFWRRDVFVLRCLHIIISSYLLCPVFQETESHHYVLHSERWKWTVHHVQHFEAMNCTSVMGSAMLFFAQSVNINMLPVTLNHIVQKKSWKSWVEGGCNWNYNIQKWHTNPYI